MVMKNNRIFRRGLGKVLGSFFLFIWKNIILGRCIEWATVIIASCTVLNLWVIQDQRNIMENQNNISSAMVDIMKLQERRGATQEQTEIKRVLLALKAELRINNSAVNNQGVLSRPLLESTCSPGLWAMSFAMADSDTITAVGEAYVAILRSKEASKGWHTIDSLPANLNTKIALWNAEDEFLNDENIQKAMAFDPKKYKEDN